MPKEMRSFPPSRHEDGDETTKSRMQRPGGRLPFNEAPDLEDREYEINEGTPERTEVGEGIYAYGHYLDLSDPHDAAFYEAKLGEDTDATFVSTEIKNEEYMDDFHIRPKDAEGLQPSKISEPMRHSALKNPKVDFHKSMREDGAKTKRRRNLKTLKKRPLDAIGRFFRKNISEMKKDLFFGEKKNLLKYLTKDEVYQHDMYEEPIDEDVDNELKKYPREINGKVYYFDTPEEANAKEDQNNDDYKLERY